MTDSCETAPLAMAIVNQVFPSAPMGRRVIAPMVFAVAVILGSVAFSYVKVSRTMPGGAAPFAKLVASLSPLMGFVFVVPFFLIERSRMAQFSIEANCLVLGRKRFPLEGLVEVSRDPEIMRRAKKVLGSGGLGSIRGHFRSKRVGKFYAFMTGTENAVVLRWPDKVVAVSPADTEFFIYSARSAAGLK
jgi:hypothetical protein